LGTMPSKIYFKEGIRGTKYLAISHSCKITVDFPVKDCIIATYLENEQNKE
jgi:hypothetical protein